MKTSMFFYGNNLSRLLKLTFSSEQFHNSCAIWSLMLCEALLLDKLEAAINADFDKGKEI